MTPASTPPVPIVLSPRTADHELLRRLIEQERIAGAAPGPEWTDYLVSLARAALSALERLLSPARDVIAGLGLSMDTVATVLLVLLAATAAALATIGVLRLLRRRRRPAVAETSVGPAQPLPASASDPRAWRALLDERLRAGGIAEALEAAWWWLAASVSRGPVDPSWTSRELLARAGRLDLGRWAAALDRMTYGPERPGAEDVRGLIDALEAAV
jgi:hypothetical protein